MGTTVSNQNLGVATKKSEHSGKTEGATDVCWNPPHTVASPHENDAPTERATAHTSTKTVIDGAEIMHTNAVIGPVSDPAHPDVGGGVVSTTYRMEARPTAGSPNVKVEQQPVVRATDPTTQNHANTTGKITPPTAEGAAEADEEKKKQRCTIEVLDVECDHRPVGDRKFLEVLDDDTVKLLATRINAIEKDKGPVCPPPPGGHLKTKFIVTRSGGGLAKKEEEFVGKDDLTLSGSWFGAEDQDTTSVGVDNRAEDVRQPGSDDYVSRYRGTDTSNKMSSERKEQIYRDQRGGGELTSKQNRNLRRTRDAEQRRSDALDAQAEKRGNVETYAEAAIKVGNNVMTATKLPEWWKRKNDPVAITVRAEACSGAKVYQIRAFPSQEIEFDLLCAEFTSIFDNIKSFARVLQRIGNDVCGFEMAIDFFVDPVATFSLSYKELDHDVNARLTKNSVNRVWSLNFVVGRLVYFMIDVGVSILPFIKAMGPAGWTVATALDWMGVEATVGIKLVLSISPTIGVGMDQHNEAAITKFEWNILIDIFFNVKISWRGKATIRGGVVVKMQPKFGKAKASPEKVFEFSLLAGTVDIGFRGVAQADYWGLRDGKTIEHYPASWKMNYGERRFAPLAGLL